MKFVANILFCVLLTAVSCVAKNRGEARLDHVALHVKNVAESARFYTEVLGLQILPDPFKDAKHRWLKTGKHTALHLIEKEGSWVIPGKATHWCYSIRYIEKFTNLLQARGIVYENWEGEKGKMTVRADGVRQLYVQDADGYWVEVNDAKP